MGSAPAHAPGGRCTPGDAAARPRPSAAPVVTAARRRPHSANQLQRVVRAYAREYGLAEKRVRDWISYMAMCGALERAGAAGQSPPHYVKGGIALELRMPGRARATKDLDVGFRAEAQADLVRVLEEALATEYEDFSFRRAREPHVMPAGTIRVESAPLELRT